MEHEEALWNEPEPVRSRQAFTTTTPMQNHELNVTREFLRRTKAALEAFDQHHQRLCNQLAVMRTLVDQDAPDIVTTRRNFDRLLQTAMASISGKAGQIESDLAEIQSFLTVVPFRSPESSEDGREAKPRPPAPQVNTHEAAPNPGVPEQSPVAPAADHDQAPPSVTIVIALGDRAYGESGSWLGKGKIEAAFRELAIALRNL
jgi:hypothetical protein